MGAEPGQRAGAAADEPDRAADADDLHVRGRGRGADAHVHDRRAAGGHRHPLAAGDVSDVRRSQATDGKTHDVAVYFDASARTRGQRARQQQVVWSTETVGDLTRAEDRLARTSRCSPRRATTSASTGATSTWPRRRRRRRRWIVRRGRAARRASPTAASCHDDRRRLASRAAGDDAGGGAWSLELGKVGAEPVSRWLMLAYDDLYSIQYMQEEPAALLAAQRLGSRRSAQGRRQGLRVAAEALRGVRRGADGRPDQGRRREVRQALRAGLSPVLRGGQVRRRRQRPAAAVLQGEPFATAASAPWTCSIRWRRSSCCSARRWPSPSSCRS